MITIKQKGILLLFILLILFFYQYKRLKALEYFNNKDKVVVCLFGVIPRSIKYTWESINKNIIEPLKREYDVDIYIFNLNVENTKVDGVVLNQKDIEIIPYDYKEEELQTSIEHEMRTLHKKYKFRYPYIYTSLNCFRQMYSEYRVGKFLEKSSNKYKGALVCGPDYNIYNSLNMAQFKDSLKSNNSIYGSNQNDATGYTNGFYFGKINPLCKILKRYDNFTEFEEGKDYEFLVKEQFKKYNLKRNVSDIIFFKIRANKVIHWQLDRNYNKNNDTTIVKKYIEKFKTKL